MTPARRKPMHLDALQPWDLVKMHRGRSIRGRCYLGVAELACRLGRAFHSDMHGVRALKSKS